MNRFVITGLSAAVALLAIAIAAPSADAQQFYNERQGDVVFVAPNGDILDYVPSGAAYARDRRGNRVLVDAYGNVIATEMRARGYYPRPPVRDANNNDAYYGDDPYGDGRYAERGAVTGSIPRNAPIDRQPLDDQPYPQRGDDYASIEPDQQAPDVMQPKPPQEPVITLKNKSKSEIVALQVFLDRAGISPGAIDGRMGANVTKAIYAYQQMRGETLDPNNTDAILEQLRMSGGLPLVSYTITPADAAGPYVAEIPEDYAHKAAMSSLGYTSTTEMLAERFHMDEGFLKEINPGVDFTVPGTIVKVVNPGEVKAGSVARIIADKGRKQVCL